MNRRDFLSMAAGAGALLSASTASGARYLSREAGSHVDSVRGKLLVLIELKGGNDGLNTVVPFDDPLYYSLRSNLAIPRESVIALDQRAGLHPSLLPLLPLWRDGQLAIVQGVGYAGMNASHYRSMQIWDTASRAEVYRRDGWLSRAFARWPAVQSGLSIARWGSVEAGPFAGLASADASAALSASMEAALHAVFENARPDANGAIRLTLDGFDTHARQSGRHAALLTQFAQGCAMLRAELTRRGRWNDTLIVTYSEFGRSVRENANGGTDHGGAAAHFVMGGRVKGGVYGRAPDLTALNADGGLPVGVDYRQLYATALGPFFGMDAQTIRAVLDDDIRPLRLLRV
jgi:uncharacterized protein (DUF1501 family)